MGIDVGDFDNDGRFDLVVTNFAHDYDTLYRNLGGSFVDHSFVAGLAVPTFAPLGWGVHFLDVDHDMDLDLFMSYGHIYPQVDADPVLHETFLQRDLLLLNQEENSRTWPPRPGALRGSRRSGRGSAAGDLDNDLDLDIVEQPGRAADLMVNESEGSGHSILVELLIPRVRARRWGRVSRRRRGIAQIRQVSSGGSYASRTFRAHFGLGETPISTDSPSPGSTAKETFERLPADRAYVIRRGYLRSRRSLR
jgi:hypothetical protein